MIFEVNFVVKYAQNFYFACFVRHYKPEPLTMTVAVRLCFFNNFCSFAEWHLKITFDSFNWSALENIVRINADANQIVQKLCQYVWVVIYAF